MERLSFLFSLDCKEMKLQQVKQTPALTPAINITYKFASTIKYSNNVAFVLDSCALNCGMQIDLAYKLTIYIFS